MEKKGDQVLVGNQNKTLYDSNNNGIEVHLFEVFKENCHRKVHVLDQEKDKRES